MGCFFSLSPFVAYIIKEGDTPPMNFRHFAKQKV